MQLLKLRTQLQGSFSELNPLSRFICTLSLQIHAGLTTIRGQQSKVLKGSLFVLKCGISEQNKGANEKEEFIIPLNGGVVFGLKRGHITILVFGVTTAY